MPARLKNLLWLLLLLASTVLALGWLAESLITLDQQNTRNWQLELQQANNEKSAEITQWLAAQTTIAKDIGQDIRITNLLERVETMGNLDGQLIPDQAAAEALYDLARDKYGLNNTYLFKMDGNMVLKQDNARDLPLKIRETLATAYQTGLDRYLFVSFFNNQKWFFSSARLQKDGRSIGYIMYMAEVDNAMSPLQTEGFRWRFVDFYLARRSGDDGVFLIDLSSGQSSLFKLAQLDLPLFKGVANEFGTFRFPDGRNYMTLVTSIPGHPFWQNMNAIPIDVAEQEVRKARMYYIGGALAFMIFILMLGSGLFRRVLNPQRPLLPAAITRVLGIKDKLPKGQFNRLNMGAATARNSGHAGDETRDDEDGDKNTRERNDVGALGSTPHSIFGRIKSAFTGKGRELSEEEKERIKADSAKPDLRSKPKPEVIKQEDTPLEAPKTLAQENAEKREAEEEAKKPVPEPEKTQEEILAEREAAREKEQIKQIHRCLENERYRLFFQPILDTSSKDKVMFETLLRLVNDDGELMQPGQFIPLAIKHKFIDQVDDMVIVASLRRHMEILSQGKQTMLSINLSYGAFRSMTFRDTYQEGLQSGKIRPDLLNFELSSKEIIEDDAAMRFVRDMQASGCKFSVDYFGNVASVNAAKKLKFDYMKINCLRFEGLGEGDPKAVEEFREVILAGHKLKLPMIAEKVENKAVMWLCEKLNVPYVQGFYLAEPSPKLALGW